MSADKPEIGDIFFAQVEKQYIIIIKIDGNKGRTNTKGVCPMSLNDDGSIKWIQYWQYMSKDLICKICEDCNEICGQQCKLKI